MATIKGTILTTPCMSTSCPNLKLYLLPRAACWVHTRPMDFTSHFIGKCNYERCLSRDGEKSLVPGVRLIMAGYWSGQRAPAMSSRPVRAHYVNRSTGLMVFMMARVNRPVGTSFPGNQVMQRYCRRHLMQNHSVFKFCSLKMKF